MRILFTLLLIFLFFCSCRKCKECYVQTDRKIVVGEYCGKELKEVDGQIVNGVTGKCE